MFFDVQHCIWKSYSHTLILRFQAYTLKEWMRPASHLRLLKRKTEVSEYFLELIPETQLLSSHRGAYGAMLGGPTVPATGGPTVPCLGGLWCQPQGGLRCHAWGAYGAKAQGGLRCHASQKFSEHVVILCFERRLSQTTK